MGCVITRSSEPHIIATNLKFPLQHRAISECQTESAPDSTQKLTSEHQTSEQQASQSGSPAHGSPSQGFLKQLRTLKSMNTAPGKKLDPFPRLILPSNNASLQDVSFKGGSLEGSFAHDMLHNAQTAGPSPSEMSHLKTDLQNLRVMKESTPCFAKPSSFRNFTPSLNNNHLEIAPQDRENQWSFGPLKDSHISLAPSSEIQDSKSSFRERQTSEEKGIKERSDSLKVPIAVEKGSLIIEDREVKKEIGEPKPVEEKPTKPAKIAINVEKSSIVLEDKEVKREETETQGPMLKAKNINQKLQRLLLSDSMAGSGFGAAELKSPAKSNNLDQKLIETSPSKTLLSIFDAPFTTDSITKKSLDLPDQTLIAASTTNASSIATISNLINLCRDVKNKDFEKKFRTNLVDLIKEKRQNSGESDSKRQAGEKKRTSILIKNGRRFSGNNGSTLQNSSSHALSKSGFSNNLLNMMKDEESKTPQGPTSRNKSVQIRHEDVFGDLAVPSPIRKADDRLLGKYHMPQIPRLAQFHSTLNKYSESSLQHDKSINFDEGLSRMDWDKYSIVEHINNVEIDDRSLSQTHLEGSIALDNNTQLNSSVTGTEILETKEEAANISNILKSKSVPYNDKAEDGENLTAHKSTPHQTSRKTVTANDTVSTLQYLSPQQVPRTLTVGTGRGKRLQTYCRADSQVVETNRVDVSVDDEGQKKINQYIMIKEIGRGGYGKVKLSFNVETKTQNAIKIANKKKLKRKLLTRQKSAYNQLSSEIAIMKKLDHPNIVKLFEVIDCPSNDKLYLVMEYVKRGSVMSKGFWRQATRAKGLIGNPDDNDGPMFKKKMILSEPKARKYFRHLALGLDFLHNFAEIVHRDIKPENLLISEDDVLKISDFGISQIMQGDDLLENNVGTKYYLAPEAWEGKAFHGKPTDIWAAGGTLYYFLVGKPPFDGINPQDIQSKIQSGEPTYPEDLNPKAVELIKGCLKKDPLERLTIEEILRHPWLTNDGQDPLVNEDMGHVEVTEEEVSKALTKLRFMAAIRVMAKLKKTLNVSRRNIARRKTACTVPEDSMYNEEVEQKKLAYQQSQMRSEKIMKKNRNDE